MVRSEPIYRGRLRSEFRELVVMQDGLNHVERFRAVMGFQPIDRLPRSEWAMWWDETIDHWKQQGLPADR